MYSIIDSCDETSGWHLPGLRNVKETALSLATQASPCEDGRNLATMSPAGLNILRCHKALLHTVGCTSQCCQERESVLSGMWLAPLWQASVTFQWLHVRPTQTVRHRNRLQHSGSNSWSRFSLKKHLFFVARPQSDTQYSVCEMYLVCDWFFCCCLVLWGGSVMFGVMYQSFGFTDHPSSGNKSTSTFEVGGLCSETQRSCLSPREGNRRETDMNMRSTYELHTYEWKDLWSVFKLC